MHPEFFFGWLTGGTFCATHSAKRMVTLVRICKLFILRVMVTYLFGSRVQKGLTVPGDVTSIYATNYSTSPCLKGACVPLKVRNNLDYSLELAPMGRIA